MANCLVCHRTLRKEPSLSRGIGPSCAKKVRNMAGLTGTGGQNFSVLGDAFWERFIAEHVAVKNRRASWDQVASSLPSHIAQPQGARIVAEQIGQYAVYGTKIQSGADLAHLFQDLSQSDREKLYVACCDEEGNLIGTQCVSIGSLDASIAHPREILKAPFLLGAKKFYILHNHPSGNPEPSNEDVAVTMRVDQAAKIVGISFGGQAVIGNGEYAFIDSEGHSTKSKINEPSERQSVPLFDTVQQGHHVINKTQFRSPDDVTRYAREKVFRDDKKGVFLICLNTKHEAVAVSPFSTDDFSQNTRALVMENAAGCFLVADGNVDQFEQLAKKFQPMAKTLGIELIDGIQVRNTNEYSLRQAGRL